MTDCHLYKLPNELLLHILAPIPTPALLPFTVLSHRIYSIILRILHNRLIVASELQSHSLLLECYHPSAKLTEPPYFCTYVGTDRLSKYESHEENYDANLVKRLGELRNMYSRFRPHHRELEPGGRRVRRPPGDVPGSRTFPNPGTVSDRYEGEAVKQTVNLEGHERFTQLVSQTNLVKIGPRNGLYTSFVEVEEGVIRVFRDWLGEMAARGGEEIADEVPGGKKLADDESIRWIGSKNNTGLRINVKERKWRQDTPILIRADEDMPVSYDIELDELIVRTSYLVLVLEKSMVQEDNSSSKAVVFGSFG